MTVTVETDSDFNPGNTGTYATAFTFPIRSACSRLTFDLTNNGDRPTAARYHMNAGGPTTYLNTGFSTASGAADTKTYTTTDTGPLISWDSCNVDLGGNTGFVGLVHLKVTQIWEGETTDALATLQTDVTTLQAAMADCCAAILAAVTKSY